MKDLLFGKRRAESLAVECDYCGVEVGLICIDPRTGIPLEHQAAHHVRAVAAEERRAVLGAVVAGIAHGSQAPAVGGIAAAVDLPKAAVIRHLTALEAAGRIRRDPAVPGVITLVDEAGVRL